jgi:hypothetical protein
MQMKKDRFPQGDIGRESVIDSQDLKLRALRYAAKAGYVVHRLRSEEPYPEEDTVFRNFNGLLMDVKCLLEAKDYGKAMQLAKKIKHDAEQLLLPDKTGQQSHICPICFDTVCPHPHCNTSIIPSSLEGDTCRTYCHCGAIYHICCIQKGEYLTCIKCHEPLYYRY